jgi:drug/metabolite transporter (DMT)-like permease
MLWVTGSLYSKNKLVSADSNLMTTSLQLIAAGIGSALIATFTTEWKGFSFTQISLTAWGGLLYLIIFGSLAAYLAFTWLIPNININ